MTKVCARAVPKDLTIKQKLRRKFVCGDLVEALSAEPDFLDTIATGDGSWIFAYDPETKRQSFQWKIKNFTRPLQKSCMCKSKIRTIITVFFESKGILQAYEHYYTTILGRLQ